MTHVHTPEHGSCGACSGAKGCPMVYCPTCPTPVLCEQAEALQSAFGHSKASTVDRPGPSLGRTVHVLVHPTLNNGSDVATAVVVRAWPRVEGQPPVVNLRVFLDGSNHSHEWATSRYVWPDEATARQHAAGAVDGWVGVTVHAFWPPRVD